MEHSESQTRELLNRARTGDSDALGELLDAHRGYLRGIAGRLLDPRLAARLDASDIIQQTCLSVHRRMVEFTGDDPAQFLAWLRRIHENNIRNAARDQQARRRSPQREAPEPGSDQLSAGDPTPSAQAIRAEEQVRLTQAITRLPSDEQQAVRLRYFEGCTVAEVAQRMQLSRDALIWLLKRALRSVRAYLDESATEDQRPSRP